MPVTSCQKWTKLVAAGCIVGVLSSVSVRANAYDDGYGYEGPAPYDDAGDDGYATTPYTAGYDEDDGYYAPEPTDEEYAEEPEEEVEAPEEDDMGPTAEEPEEEVEAPEEEDAMDPTALAPDSGDVSVAPDALAPTAVTGVYNAYPGSDYIPFDAFNAPTPPNLVLVEDIPDSGVLVDSQAECEAMCDGTPECNAASFYIEEVIGFNCFLKTIAEACELPADASEDPNATLLLRCDSPLGAPLAVAPLADAPLADAPLADPFGVPDAGAPLEAGTTDVTDTTERDITGDDGEVTGDTDVAVSMCSSVAAIAVAGAAAVFM